MSAKRRRYHDYLRSEDPYSSAPRTTLWRHLKNNDQISEEDDEHFHNHSDTDSTDSDRARGPEFSVSVDANSTGISSDVGPSSPTIAPGYLSPSSPDETCLHGASAELSSEEAGDNPRSCWTLPGSCSPAGRVEGDAEVDEDNIESLPIIPEVWADPRGSCPLGHNANTEQSDEDSDEESNGRNNQGTDDDEEWFDAECLDDPDIPNSQDDEPLYQGAPISVGQSLLLILAFSMRHQLSGECLQDLLTLISLHCIIPNLCKTSLYLFRQYFSKLKAPLVFHKFCGACKLLLRGDDASLQNCTNCQSELSKTEEFFIEIPLVEQLTNLFARKGFFQDIQHRFTRKKQHGSNIEDIYDGREYNKHFRNGGFLSNCNNISFFWYTDGIPLFKSSKFSIWPMYFMINELPYDKRILKENMLFAGLWYGSSKPCMGSFLEPFHTALHNIHDGIKVTPFGCSHTITIKGLLIGGTCDLPAKCIMLNMTQFNGKFGCGRCKQPGKHVPSGRGFTHVYPYDYANIDGPKRTHDETKEAATAALLQGKPVDGIKGPSWFMFLGCDIIRGTAIDYMHQVLLGIVRKMLHLWFSQSTSRESYSLRFALADIDRRLLNIKPPNFISRIPRGIAEHIKYWKASECRSFLFYYSVPLLSGVMKTPYFMHYLLLVQAIFLLNSTSISPSDIAHCEQQLRQYVCAFATLYGEQHMGANIHLLLHLADNVRDLGPLWVSSCFHFEGINGELLNLFHGTQRPELQIVNSIGAMQQFPAYLEKMSESVLHFYYHLSSKGNIPHKRQFVCPGVFVLGKAALINLSTNTLNRLRSHVQDLSGSQLIYKRIMLRKLVYHSSSYTVPQKRSSYTVCYQYSGELMFGQVQYYVLVNTTCFAVIQRMLVAPIFSIECWATGTESPFSVILKGHLPDENSSVHVIPVDDIASLCVLIGTDQCDEVFIAVPPNKVEKD